MKLKSILTKTFILLAISGMTVWTTGCSDAVNPQSAQTGGEHQEARERGEHQRGEHRESHQQRERGEHNAEHGDDGHGEEDGTQLKLSDTYDVTKNGAHLVLKWDPESTSFKGVVKNVSDKDLERVRVEVHYARRYEIGPTRPGDLKPGESREVTLKAKTDKIASWNTHAEIGNEEHGAGHSEGAEGREGRGEHGAGEGREGRGEHAGREGKERGEGHSERQRGEHDADDGGEGEGEEDGTQLKLSDTYDVTKGGAHLLLKWEPESTSFKGVVKNVSDKNLERVRVEVHYTRRFEIGPTKPGVLKPGESREVTLKANTNRIVSWNTHAEIGNEEHGAGDSEHGDGEGREHRG